MAAERGLSSFGVTKQHVEENSQSKKEIASKKELERQRAVKVIERWWRAVKDRRVFHILKQAICTSEYSLTHEIIRKIAPAEAEILTDPAIQARIKFRFGGDVFPPFIVFKIFTSMSSGERKEEKGCDRGGAKEESLSDLCIDPTGLKTSGIKYISGRRMIRPDSEAAEDARRQMGNRKYCDQVLEDVCQNQQLGITDEVDITTMKDYMQYMAITDECPAYQGGRENVWRKVDLSALPRHTPLHSLLDLLDGSKLVEGRFTPHKIKNIALSSPHRQQAEKLKLLSSLNETPPLWTHPSHHRGPLSAGSEAQKRSRQAKRRAEKMRKMYIDGVKGEEREELASPTPGGEEEWEGEVDDLYQWTQKLSFDDIR